MQIEWGFSEVFALQKHPGGSMRNLRIFCLAGLFVLIAQMSVYAETVVIYPEEYPIALRNPLMGFRPGTSAGSSYSGDPYATVTHCYIKWNEIENYESDTIDKIKTVCNNKWKDMEKYNVKVIPRVYLDWDSDPNNENWPADMTAGDYSSEQFKTRLRRLIQRLGQCWNNDPRVAWIQMGIIGWWGEQETPWPTAEIQQLMGDEFTAAFPNKKVLVRRPWDAFTAYPFGGYWDSWAHINQIYTQGAGIDNLNNTTARWKVNVWEGEVAYNWGDWTIQPGQDPTDTVSDPVHRNFLIDTIRDLHCSALGWVSGYSKTDPVAVAGAEEVQRAFGYRYLLNEVRYPAMLTPGAEFSVQFKVTNVGSAPVCYNWPVEISLLNPATKAVVWHDTFDGCDIRNWLSGDQYNSTTRVYTVPAVANTVNGTFQLPTGIANGEYILALAILDPSGMLPSVRFATVNYFNGGRHPIGYTGVGVTPSQYELSPSTFNDPAADNSLRYSLTRAPLSQNPEGLIQAESYTTMSGIQKENCSDTGGGQNIGYINNSDWAQYSITVPSAGSYPVDFRVASAGSGGTINMVVGGTVIGSATIPVTGGWQSWTTVRTTATFTAAGTQTLRLNFVGGSGYLFNVNWFQLISTNTTPAAPTGLVAVPGDGSVLLNWADNTEADLWVYGIYRSKISGGPYTHVRDVFTSDWKDNNVTPGTTYYYAVTALDLFGNESGYSNSDSAIPNPHLLTPDPAEFAEYPAALSSMSISMSAVPGTASAGPVEYLFTEAGGDVSGWQSSPAYIAVNLQPGTEYTYTVTMRDSVGNQTVPSDPFSAFTYGDPDIVKDYVVDLDDLAALAARWLESNCYLSGLCGGTDLNADGSVGLKDFQMLAVLWLTDVTPPGFKESGGLVCMEAEHYDSIEQRNEPAMWVQASATPGYVGDGYMWTVDGAYSNTPSYDQGTRILYSIVFSSTGTFNVYMRRYCDPTGSNSVWVGLDGVSNGNNDNTQDYDQWIWKSLGTVTVSTPGVKTLDVVRREQGYKIDRIVLTQGAIPTGNGPAESPR